MCLVSPCGHWRNWHNVSVSCQEHLRAMHQAQIEMLDGQVMSLRFAWQQNCGHLPGHWLLFLFVHVSSLLLPPGGTCQSARRNARSWSWVWGRRRSRLQTRWGLTAVRAWKDCVWSARSTRPFWRGRTPICMPRLLRGWQSKATHHPELPELLQHHNLVHLCISPAMKKTYQRSCLWIRIRICMPLLIPIWGTFA